MDEESLCCPITGERFKDPVMDPEGNTYERSAILEWLAKHKTSPITRSPLNPGELVTNRVLASLLGTSPSPSAAAAAADANANASASAAAGGLSKLSLAAGSGSPAPAFEMGLRAVQTDEGTLTVSLDVLSESKGQEHAGATIICVIDISYSMDNFATMHGDEEGSSGLSLLDIVKHATHTIIETLGPHDMLGVVSYANTAEVVLPIRAMVPENKKLAWERVEALETNGQTNLWDGLRVAMEMAAGAVTENCSILLLTDGLPNIEPPRGHLPTLKKYLEDAKDLRCEISTFGFGYKLDTNLLLGIAMLGRGSYAFIPDSSFVGTCFVNATANILATAVPLPTLEITPLNGAKTLGTLCSMRCTGGEGGLTFDLPNLQHGQRKDILIRITHGPDSSLPAARVVLRRGGAGGVVIKECQSAPMVPDGQDAQDLHANHVRLLLANLITDNCKSLRQTFKEEVGGMKQALEEAQAGVKLLLSRVDAATGTPGAIERFKEDLEGQVTQAFSREDWYRKWGVHYLPALARAHSLQVCTNFKDPGLQGYAGPKFSAIRDHAEDVFIKLPPPKPSLDSARGAGGGVTSMSTFHNASNPCFAAGPVRMASGALKDVSQIRAGDVVATSISGMANATAVVKCVVATRCAGGTCELVKLPPPDGHDRPSVLVTPFHPVRLVSSEGSTCGGWCFPGTLEAPRTRACSFVYSFVLEPPTAASMVIGQYEAVTLGHGLATPVAQHPFLGTGAVLTNLSRLRGWADGLVYLPPGAVVRDPASGLIMGFVQDINKANACKIPGQLQPLPMLSHTMMFSET